MQMYLAKRNSSDSLTTGTVFLEYKTLIVQNISSLFLGQFCLCPHPSQNVTGSFYESLFLEKLKQAKTSAYSFSLARGLTTTQNYNSCPMSRVSHVLPLSKQTYNYLSITSRPLTVSNLSHTDYPEPLTTNRLLTSKTSVVLSPPDNLQRSDQYSRKRWRRVQYFTSQFWFKWKRKYFTLQYKRKKWNPTKETAKMETWLFFTTLTYIQTDGHSQR